MAANGDRAAVDGQHHVGKSVGVAHVGVLTSAAHDGDTDRERGDGDGDVDQEPTPVHRR
jgi:hypothetical protein